MKLVLISDTHGKHEELVLPKGDMIIHAGDVSSRGTLHEVSAFLDWFGQTDFKYKIFIAGNHDFLFEKISEEELSTLIPDNIIYLNDSQIEIEGVKIWGSPVQPWFYDWAFNRQRGAEIAKHWKLIAPDTDVLITHGPPHGILDKTNDGLDVGCEELVKTISKLNIKLSVFGHIHEAYGQTIINGTNYVNASVLDLKYNCVNEPIVFDYPEG